MINPKLTYTQINTELSALDDEELITLLDGSSIKIGDSAAELLYFERRAMNAVYEAITEGKLKTALGRKRALFILMLAGPEFPKSLDACLQLLRDRSKIVVDEALFGLCHWNEISTLAALDAVTCRAATKNVERAKNAIQVF